MPGAEEDGHHQTAEDTERERDLITDARRKRTVGSILHLLRRPMSRAGNG
jgi:hypothetical protein